jgi:hypothetical protein
MTDHSIDPQLVIKEAKALLNAAWNTPSQK